jgi:hypothetical protein
MPNVRRLLRAFTAGDFVHKTEVEKLVLHYERLVAAKFPPSAAADEPRKRKPHERKTWDKLTSKKKKNERTGKLYAIVDTLRTAVGGSASQLTTFMVDMMHRSVVGGRTYVGYLTKDIVGRLLADPGLRKKFEKELNKLRKPSIAQFRFARLGRGLTVRGMDALRFAMPWCPGHDALAKDRKEFLGHLEHSWCRSGPTIDGLTMRTCEEQEEDREREEAEAAEEAAAEEEELREQAEAEAAAAAAGAFAREAAAEADGPVDTDEGVEQEFAQHEGAAEQEPAAGECTEPEEEEEEEEEARIA